MVNVFWFRRDLRLEDNHGLWQALLAGIPVVPLFIFDDNILNKLEDKADARVRFIFERLVDLNTNLAKQNRGIIVRKGDPVQVFDWLTSVYKISKVFTNADYEPYSAERDAKVKAFLATKGVEYQSFTDHVIFAPGQVLKSDGKPYTVYTPYATRWKAQLDLHPIITYPSQTLLNALSVINTTMPCQEDIGLKPTHIAVPALKLNVDLISGYALSRDFPAMESTSLAGVHLRFGTVSVRELALFALKHSPVYLGELIWREFFMQILFHFPETVKENFYRKYNGIAWLNDTSAFEAWRIGMTGYPLVDAGMRELNATGLMHNRVRMVVASFLTKHLLIDWRWGEAYFASKLLDFELSSNVGNWQWAAGTGCDAAPYFRVFNPAEQARKFDPKGIYIKKWVKEFGEFTYPAPIVDHGFARIRAIETYKKGIEAFGR